MDYQWDFDTEEKWIAPSKIDSNPMAWMISVEGFIVDARQAPRYIQEEAYRKGRKG